MEQNNFDKLLQDAGIVGAPEGFTETVMSKLASLPDCERQIVSSAALPMQLKKVGISMITTAALLFVTVFIPGNQIDVFNHTVRAQTQVISEHADKASNWVNSPIRELHKMIEDIDKKLNKIREEH